jgi:Zn finger protein HypA/HybF involved in hydrogenase expression
MTHYKLLDRDPSVIVTSNRNELKIYEPNTIYLNNGDNFELRFFNPLNETIGIDIIFDGIKRNINYLVLKPGQDIILDRFLDKQNKMVFETYLVDGNNKDAVKAIEYNGLITINFHKEYNYNIPYYTSTRGYSGTHGRSGTQGASGTSGLCSNHEKHSSVKYCSTQYITNNMVEYTNTNTTLINYQQNFKTNLSSNIVNEIETGRIESGDISNQMFKEVNINFEEKPFHSITYQLLPYSSKNINIKEIRNYCSDCGYRIRKDSWKYCPKCGSKLH